MSYIKLRRVTCPETIEMYMEVVMLEKRIARFCTTSTDDKAILAVCYSYNLGMLKICSEILSYHGY